MTAATQHTPSPTAAGRAIKDRKMAIERARALTARIRARAPRTEEDRRIPDETIAELLDSGLFNIITPKLFGGSELGLASLVETTVEFADACGSTGWVFGVLAGHSWLLNLFPGDAQYEVFSDPNALIATVFRLSGKITPVEGGYRLVGGSGRFCSGIDHASWVIVGNAVIRGEGAPPEPRFFIIPRKDIEVEDDWFTAGMRGTGSRSIKIADAFIPEHRSVRASDMVGGTAPGSSLHAGPVYRMKFSDVVPFSLVGAPLGMARGAVRALSEGLSGRLKGATDQQLAEQSATVARLAEAASDIDAAMTLVLADATLIDTASAPDSLTPMERARIPRDWAYAAQRSRYAVNRIFEAAGGSGIYNSSEIQRIWRDVNSAAQHGAFGWDGAMANYGRSLLGLNQVNYGLRVGQGAPAAK
jgi:3-hydroxy-9,10-secoandrosta-1,3,5(10)-triene-9,17-dione monooxygenase